MGKRETVLLGLCGHSPAVVTETIWALATETPPIIPSRVVLITTASGRDAVRRDLLLSGVWARLCDVLQVSAPALRFGDTGDAIRVLTDATGRFELDDLVDSVDSQAAADFILDVLRQFVSNPDTQVVFSIAGGRKTMAALGAQCMSLLGRSEDRLCHVMVPFPFDQPDLQPRFYFPDPAIEAYALPGRPSVPSTRARVSLCSIPFVRCRHLFEQRTGRVPGTFAGTVRLVNAHMTSSGTAHIILAPADLCCTVQGFPVRFAAIEFALYWMLAERAAQSKGTLVGQQTLLEHFEVFAQEIDPDTMPEIINHDRFRARMDADNLRKVVNMIKARLAKALRDCPADVQDAVFPSRSRGHYGIDEARTRVEIDVK